jgi:hypothetical protein
VRPEIQRRESAAVTAAPKPTSYTASPYFNHFYSPY